MENQISQHSSIPSVTPSFLSAVWAYFALAIGICALGVFAGPFIFNLIGASMGVMWLIFIATIVLIVTVPKWSASPAWKIPMFTLFAFLMGVSTFPIVAYAAAIGHTDYVFKALISAGCLFAAAAIWGFTTKRDLSGWGGFLTMTLIGLIIVGILQIFWFSNTVAMITSGIGVVLFSAFAAYDIQNIKKGLYPNPISAAISLFLDMILLFRDLLMFMLSLASNE